MWVEQTLAQAAPLARVPLSGTEAIRESSCRDNHKHNRQLSPSLLCTLLGQVVSIRDLATNAACKKALLEDLTRPIRRFVALRILRPPLPELVQLPARLLLLFALFVLCCPLCGDKLDARLRRRE